MPGVPADLRGLSDLSARNGARQRRDGDGGIPRLHPRGMNRRIARANPTWTERTSISTRAIESFRDGIPPVYVVQLAAVGAVTNRQESRAVQAVDVSVGRLEAPMGRGWRRAEGSRLTQTPRQPGYCEWLLGSENRSGNGR